MSCFPTRRERSRCIWSCAVVATFVTCSVFIYVSLQYNGKSNKSGEDISTYHTRAESLTSENCSSECSTKDCIFFANILQNNMNPAVDPCEDFYSFSCGKFVDQYGKEDNKSFFDILTTRFMLEIKDLLDNLNADPNTPIGKMKITYDSCMKYHLSEIEAIPTVLEFLKQMGIPDWPNLPSDFVFHEPDLATALGTLAAYKEHAFFEIKNVVVNGEKMFNATVTKNDPKGLRLTDSIQQYFLKRIFHYFNIEDERTKEMEEKFMEIRNIFEQLRRDYTDIVCGSRNASEFYLNCSETVDGDWRLLCGMLEAFVDVANITNLISNRYVLFPERDSTCPTIKGFLRDINNVSHRHIADYLAITFLISHLNELNLYFRLTKQKELDDPIEMGLDSMYLPHWQHCVHWISTKMTTVLGHVYVENIMPKTVLSEVQAMIHQLLHEIRNIISEQTWITNERKGLFFNKTNIISSLETQLKFYFNETFINNHYRQFHPEDRNFFKNVLLFQKASLPEDLQEGTEEQNLKNLKVFVINALSEQYRNAIEICLGIIRFLYPLFDETRLNDNFYLTSVVGHEIGHLLYYVFLNEEIEDEQIEEEHLKRAACFENQIGNFTYFDLDSMELNKLSYIIPKGILEIVPKEQVLQFYSKQYASKTLEENLADSFSLLLTDRLMKKRSSSEPSFLISLPYSVKQLYHLFINQEWCAQVSKEKMLFYMEKDTHNLNVHRSKSWTENSKAFSEAFNCPKGSSMNPLSKCFWFEEGTNGK